MKRDRTRLIATAALLAANILFFGNVSPFKAPSALLFVGFGLVALDLLAFWYAVMLVSRHMLSWPKGRLRRPIIGLTGFSVLLLALQSIGQLSVRDIVVVMALAVIFWFYASYYRPRHQQ